MKCFNVLIFVSILVLSVHAQFSTTEIELYNDAANGKNAIEGLVDSLIMLLSVSSMYLI